MRAYCRAILMRCDSRVVDDFPNKSGNIESGKRARKRPNPTAAADPEALRIALLSYRSKPHCGGQGVYVRHVSRELVELGHQVEVISGQPYPELDAARR